MVVMRSDQSVAIASLACLRSPEKQESAKHRAVEPKGEKPSWGLDLENFCDLLNVSAHSLAVFRVVAVKPLERLGKMLPYPPSAIELRIFEDKCLNEAVDEAFSS
jgi:hypothetical protein